MDYRQEVVDAAVAEMRHQHPEDIVWVNGTEVQIIEGPVKMARVAEAIIGAAFADEDDALVNAVLKMYPTDEGSEAERINHATDLLWDIRHVMLKRLDPLP